MARYRKRKAELNARVKAGEVSPEQAAIQLKEFSFALIAGLKARNKPNS